jgi:CubicO group peptidase (beta-lactamase class C family)
MRRSNRGTTATRASRPSSVFLVALLALSAPLVGCGTSPTPPDDHVPDDGKAYFPDATWRTASPTALGFDETRIAQLKSDISSDRYGDVDGVIVVRYGYVALEQYAGWAASQPHTMQSVTKSVTSLLFGIAAAQTGIGLAKVGNAAPERIGRAGAEPAAPEAAVAQAALGLQRPVLDVFARYADLQNVDARKRALTLEHLLTMRTSMDYWEQPYAGSPHEQLNQSRGDWTRFILDRAMTGEPGTSWAYNSGAAIAVCGALREVTGTAPDAFARENLFAPIGVTGETWFRSPYDGLPHCGGGLNLKPMDLARVGYLVLRHGRWGERQVVPEAWLDASTRPITRPVPGFFTGWNPGYGYFWWLFPTTEGGSDAGVITASGSGGQWLFVVPSLDLVVAVVAQNGFGMDLLYDGVLAAVAGR